MARIRGRRSVLRDSCRSSTSTRWGRGCTCRTVVLRKGSVFRWWKYSGLGRVKVYDTLKTSRFPPWSFRRMADMLDPIRSFFCPGLFQWYRLLKLVACCGLTFRIPSRSFNSFKMSRMASPIFSSERVRRSFEPSFDFLEGFPRQDKGPRMCV
jgi:hypothetical protein